MPGPPALLHLPQPQLPPLPSLPLPDPTLAGDMISNAGLLAGAPLGAGQAGGVFVDKVYCFCQRPGVEGGRMVGCDNAECPYEWIHFECAGISEEPEGEWFCQECRAKMAGRKRGKAQRGRRK